MTCLFVGHVLLLLGAFPHIGGSSVHIGLSMLGLILITFGTGGIKPCLTAFVGDQFEEEHQKERKRYLLFIFVFGKLASLCSTFITPFIREYVQCFGGDCYALAFGVAAALMVVALGLFIGGTKLYIRLPQEENDLKNICKCTGRDSNQKVKHLRWILLLFFPLPMFWAVFEQKGSWWTLQASQMNRHFGEGFVLNPEYMQLLNAILVLLFIFILKMGKKCFPRRCQIKPLWKLFVGLIFAVLASIAVAVVEILVIKSVMEPAHDKECLLQVLNLVKVEPVSVELTGHNIFPDRFQSFKDPVEYTRLPLGDAHRVLPVSVSQSGVTHQCKLNASESTAYSLILFGKDSVIKCKLEEDHIIKLENGEAFIRFINSHAKNITITLESTNLFAAGNYGISETVKVKGGKYVEVTISLETTTDYVGLGLLDFGATYTFIIDGDAEKVVLHKMEEVHASRIHVAWQVRSTFSSLQGRSCSPSLEQNSLIHAPDGMKSLVQALWLLNTAVGNFIVLGTENINWTWKMGKFVFIAAVTSVACLVFFFIAKYCPNPNEVSSKCCSSMLETCRRCPSTCCTMRTTRSRTASTSGSRNQIQLDSMEIAPPSN
ncbi:solute carrier family 15 member 2-like isoform X3 [Silurus meridionalis]|nr:solute carrier family 15 member 2-like isoform X3 [Silurus meridionalis]